jgi:hypothetical protein
VTCLGQTARQTFRVSDPILERSTRPAGISCHPTKGPSIPPCFNSTGLWTPRFARTNS